MWDKGIVYDVTNTTVAELIEFLDEKEYSAHECVLNIGDRGTSVLLTVGGGKKRFVVGQELSVSGGEVACSLCYGSYKDVTSCEGR